MKTIFFCLTATALLGAITACSDSSDSSNTKPPTEAGVGQAYTNAAYCMTALASGDPAKAHRFALATIAGGNSTVTFEMTPLLSGATKLDTAQTIGSIVTLADIAVAKSGAFDYVSPTGKIIEIPGEANPISGSRIMLERLDLSGKIDSSAPKYCGSFVAKIIEPAALKGSDVAATCLFYKLSPGDMLPVATAADYTACSSN